MAPNNGALSNNTPTTFEHEPLDRTKSSIRLIKILSKKSNKGLLQCAVHETTLESNTIYTCLSYVWGQLNDGGGPFPILLNGKQFMVRENLYEFLKVARKKYTKDHFWIDAISINQDNPLERNHQVAQMANIYSQAKQVFSWLGASDVGESYVSFLRLYDKWERIGQLAAKNMARTENLENTSQYRFWDAVRKYWSRAWITQEVTLAQTVKILAGSRSIDCEVIRRLSYERNFPDLMSSPRIDPGISGMAPKKLTDVIPYNDIQTFVQNGSKHFKEPEMGLAALLGSMVMKGCKIDRDRIYSIRSICLEGSRIQVDYTAPDSQVLLDVLHACRDQFCICASTLLSSSVSRRYQFPVYPTERGNVPLLNRFLRTLKSLENRLPSIYLVDIELQAWDGFELTSPYCCGTNYVPEVKCRNYGVLCLSDICYKTSGHLIIGSNSKDEFNSIKDLEYCIMVGCTSSNISSFWDSKRVKVFRSLDTDGYVVRLSLLALLEISQRSKFCHFIQDGTVYYRPSGRDRHRRVEYLESDISTVEARLVEIPFEHDSKKFGGAGVPR